MEEAKEAERCEQVLLGSRMDQRLTAVVKFEALAKLNQPIPNLNGSMINGVLLWDVQVDGGVAEDVAWRGTVGSRW